MKPKIHLLILVFAGIMTLACNCNKNNSEPQVPIYSYTEPLVNPPNHFQFVFNLSTPGDKFGHITFAEDGVWLIEKLGGGQITFFIYNGDEGLPLPNADTLGLSGGVEYTLVANNNNYEVTNFFSEFRLLDIDYESFEPKF